jgi:hypothetical protein
VTGDRSTTGHQLRLLCSVIAEPVGVEERLAAVTADDAADMMAIARAHGVEPWLAATAPTREASWAPLAEQRARFIGARARALADLRALGAMLDDIDCPWVVVKGQVLAEDLYPRPHMRYGVDIDVLVDPARFGEAVEALSEAGWLLLDRNWPLIVQTLPGQLRFRTPSGGILDLHWHLLNDAMLRAHHQLPTLDLLHRRRTLLSGLPALSGADQLVHLGLHGALSGANRLVWLTDAGLAARRCDDWPSVLQVAHRSSSGLALSLVLLRSQRWLGWSAPDDVLRELAAGQAWQQVCRTVDRISPLAADPNRPAIARSFARAVRTSAGSSAAEFVRRTAAWVRSGAPAERLATAIGDAADPRSPLFEVSDAQARQRYLAVVAESV